MPRQYSSAIFLLLIATVLAGCSGAPKKSVVKPVKPATTIQPPVLNVEQQGAYEKAVAALQNQDLMLAESSFKSLLQNQPNLVGAYINLGIIYEALERVPEALKSYEKALEINPASVDALLQLGLLHIKRGRFSLAEQRLLEAESVNSAHSLVQFNLGVLYELYLQDYDEAIEHYERYVSLSSDEDVETVKRWIKLLERK